MYLKIPALFCISFMLCSFSVSSYGQLEGNYQTPREKLCINAGWKFHLGELSQDPVGEDFDDSDWESIHVPHTLKLTSLTLDDSKMTFSRKLFIEIWDGTGRK